MTSKARTAKIDPTKGPLGKSMLLYAAPVFLTAVIQMLMSATDAAVLGNMADAAAVAAVGATGPLVGLLVSSTIGIAEGAKILLARSVGARDTARAKTVMDTSMIVALSLGVIIAAAGALLSRPMLQAMRCPEDCIDNASLYLSIYFLGTPLTMIYNFGAGIISTSGNSRAPMRYMIISGVSNVVLNIILCLILPNKVAAVAIATVVGTAISAVLVVRDLFRLESFPLDIRHMTPSRRECLIIFKIGLPMAFNTALYAISNLQIQATVNSYGSAAIAGSTAAGYIEQALSCILTATGSSIGVFVGQNIGAGNNDRAKRAIFIATAAAISLTLPLGILSYVYGELLLSIFIPTEALAISYGLTRMSRITLIYGVNGLRNSFDSSIAAFGYTYIPMLSSIVGVLVLRVVWMNFIYPLFNTFDNIFLCYTVSWSLTAIFSVIMFSILYVRFHKGKIKKI